MGIKDKYGKNTCQYNMLLWKNKGNIRFMNDRHSYTMSEEIYFIVLHFKLNTTNKQINSSVGFNIFTNTNHSHTYV